MAHPLLSDPGGERQGEVRALTGLRGLAAMNVMMSHYGEGHVPLLAWFDLANPAVDIFFCLSGFTLCLVYGAGLKAGLSFRRFAVARIARIYPLYVLVLLVAAAYSLHLGINNFPAYSRLEMLADGLRQVLLINAWPVIGTGAHWVTPMWSISVEAFCYVFVFPMLFYASRVSQRLSSSSLFSLTNVLTFVSFAVFVTFYNPAVNDHQTVPMGPVVHWVALVRGICMFAAGWTVYLIHLRNDGVLETVGRLTDTISVAVLIVLVGRSFAILNGHMVIILAPFLILGLMNPSTVTARVLATDPVHFLGIISYSIYLIHIPVRFLLWMATPGLSDNLRWWLAIVVTFVGSCLTYYLIEQPARLYIRRLSGVAGRQTGPVAIKP